MFRTLDELTIEKKDEKTPALVDLLLGLPDAADDNDGADTKESHTKQHL